MIQHLTQHTNDSRCKFESKTSITSIRASIACFGCQLEPKSKEYFLYITPIDAYAEPDPTSRNQSFPNLRCTITPHLTRNRLTYSSTTGLFSSTVLWINPNTSLIPNETVESITYLFDFSATSWVRLSPVSCFNPD